MVSPVAQRSTLNGPVPTGLVPKSAPSFWTAACGTMARSIYDRNGANGAFNVNVTVFLSVASTLSTDR
jgi:hypothetical protein